MSLDSTAYTLRAKIIGVMIRDARLTAGRQLEECAEAIGVSNSAFEEYELGDKSPSLPELESLAYYLNVPVEHFWQEKTPSSDNEYKRIENAERLIIIRQRMIGALLRQARLDNNLTVETLAKRAKIGPESIEAYELGELPIPIPMLETLAGILHRSIKEFYDRNGPVGAWITQQRAIRDFLSMPSEMQNFVSRPVNLPYLELAKRLSDMSVDKLRSVAEGLLEITY